MKLALFAVSLLCALPALGAEATIGAPDCLVIQHNPVPKTTVTWSGPCKDGYAEGTGTLTWFVNAKFSASYEGGVVRGLPHGEGYFQQVDGTQYEGGMRNGDPHGRGTMVRIDRTRYDGQWKDGNRDGAGTQTFALGGRYQGQWKDNMFHGQGKASYIGGQTYEGEFREGLPVGQSAPPAVVPNRYSLSSQDSGVGKFRAKVGKGGPAPFGKTYAEMSADERQSVRRQYAMLHPDDEPPYPLRGAADLYEMLTEAHFELRTSGVLNAHVQVDSSGAASAVNVFKSPSPAMTTVATIVLLKEKFKPGLCAGTPCPMVYPVVIQFGGE